MNIEVSHGEIVDKLTILEIKKKNITDVEKLNNITKEYDYLVSIVEKDLGISLSSPEYQKLLSINQELWVIEDDIRDKERNKEFDEEFVRLARAVYFTNDIRANKKKEMKFVSAITFLLAAVSAVKITNEPVPASFKIADVNAKCLKTTDSRTDPTGHLDCVAKGCEAACHNEKGF